MFLILAFSKKEKKKRKGKKKAPAVFASDAALLNELAVRKASSG